MSKTEVNTMPRRDGTGPNGFGPLTGRRMGNCRSGLGYGNGMGYRNRYYQNPETSKEELLREKEMLESRIKDIDKLVSDK
jgi:hypothetical protein